MQDGDIFIGGSFHNLQRYQATARPGIWNGVVEWTDSDIFQFQFDQGVEWMIGQVLEIQKLELFKVSGKSYTR